MNVHPPRNAAYCVRGSLVEFTAMALAFFITFTTYGTWLHGSAKGKGSVDRDHHHFGQAFASANPQREEHARGLMRQEVFVMDQREREVVCQAIVELCQAKGWRLWAAHVRSNHVHVVVSADRDPGRLMSDLKARASRDLTAAGFGTADRRRWTRHGSTLHLFDEAQVAAKVHYTLHAQGRPMATHDGTQPEPRTP